MSDNDSYVLQLKDVDRNMSSWWKALQNDNDFCDVTLVCDEDQIKLHKIVASTCSLSLRKILKNNHEKHSLIYLRGVKYSHLVNLIDFMYQGEVKIPQNQIEDLLNLANDLQVIGLCESEEEEIMDFNLEKANKISKGISSKIDTVVNISEDIAKNNYTVPFDNNLESRKIHNSKRKMKESEKNTIDRNGIKRNKVEHSFEKTNNNDKFSDENHDITHNVITAQKQNLDYNEDIHETITDLLNEVPFEDTETGSKDGNIKSIHEALTFSCDKCQYTTTQTESLIGHIKTAHNNTSVKTDTAYKIIDANREDKVIDVNVDDSNNLNGCPSLENDITQNITKKVTKEEDLSVKDEESAKDSNDKIKPSPKKEVSFEHQDITKLVLNYGYQRGTPSDIPEKEMESLTFSCDKCQHTSTQSESLLYHVKITHEKISSKCLQNKLSSPLQTVNINEDNSFTTAVDESSEDFNLAIDDKGTKVDSLIKKEEMDRNINENELPVCNTKTEELYLGETLKNNHKCGQCNEEFKQPESLSRHIKSIHEGLKFSCDKCQFTGTQSGSLIRHVRSVHEKIRYFCNLCDYSATQKPMLNKHIKIKH